MTTFGSFNKARLVDAACRTDFPSFYRKCFHTINPGTVYCSGWHSHALGHHLEQVRLGKIRRLIINMPPRLGKSLMASVAFAAFVLGHDPTKRVVVISYNSDLASNLHNTFRGIVESAWYQSLFPTMRISRNTEFETVTDQYGYRRATSIDGTLTGIGGDILIIDDYLKPGDAIYDNKRATANNLFFNTVLSRLDNKQTGAIVVVGQRLHCDDLTALLLRSSDEYTLLSLPAMSEREQLIPISDTQCYLRPVDDVLMRLPRFSQRFVPPSRDVCRAVSTKPVASWRRYDQARMDPRLRSAAGINSIIDVPSKLRHRLKTGRMERSVGMHHLVARPQQILPRRCIGGTIRLFNPEGARHLGRTCVQACHNSNRGHRDRHSTYRGTQNAWAPGSRGQAKTRQEKSLVQSNSKIHKRSGTFSKTKALACGCGERTLRFSKWTL